MLKPIYVVAFTGHRSSASPGRSTEELEACRPLIQQALNQIKETIKPQNGIIHLISSAAEGGDTIALEVSEEMGITTHIVLPLPIEQFKDDFEQQPEAWKRTQDLISKAEQSEAGSSLTIANSAHNRPDCYADANEQMLSSADILIALWNEEPAQGTGGTAQVWKNAEAKKLARIHINPRTRDLTDYALERLTPENDLSYKIFKQLTPHLPDHKNSEAYITQCQIALDEKANVESELTRSRLFNTIWLHGAASMLAALGVSYALAHGPHKLEVLCAVSAIELLLIGAAEIIHRKQHKTHSGEHWIIFRFAAELLRPLKYTAKYLNPLRPLIQHNFPSWRRFLISLQLTEYHHSSLRLENEELEKEKQDYINNRLIEQLTHFTDKQAEASPKATRIYSLMRKTAYSALVVVAIALVYKLSHLEWLTGHSYQPSHSFSPLEFSLYLLPIILPLLAGILLALRQSFDISRRNIRYQHMVDYLERAKINILHTHTQYTFINQVTKIEDTLLDELKEFEIAQRIGMEH